MMSEALTVKLGNRQLEIRPLTLRQLQETLPLFNQVAESARTGDMPGAIGHAATIVHTAISRANPGITIDDILDTEASIDDLIAATNVVAAASGLMLAGEALAVASPNGSGSTDSSLPPADIASQTLMN
jgi:hypothetical protein